MIYFIETHSSQEYKIKCTKKQPTHTHTQGEKQEEEEENERVWTHFTPFYRNCKITSCEDEPKKKQPAKSVKWNEVTQFGCHTDTQKKPVILWSNLLKQSILFFQLCGKKFVSSSAGCCFFFGFWSSVNSAITWTDGIAKDSIYLLCAHRCHEFNTFFDSVKILNFIWLVGWW